MGGEAVLAERRLDDIGRGQEQDVGAGAVAVRDRRDQPRRPRRVFRRGPIEDLVDRRRVDGRQVDRQDDHRVGSSLHGDRTGLADGRVEAWEALDERPRPEPHREAGRGGVCRHEDGTVEPSGVPRGGQRSGGHHDHELEALLRVELATEARLCILEPAERHDRPGLAVADGHRRDASAAARLWLRGSRRRRGRAPHPSP
jgi:hypothetical protein